MPDKHKYLKMKGAIVLDEPKPLRALKRHWLVFIALLTAIQGGML
jgi:hypothetical protein